VSDRICVTWRQVWQHAGRDITVYDEDGNPWTWDHHGDPWRNAMSDQVGECWTPDDKDPVWIDLLPLPEPPDGTRIEFEHHTDVYAAWRDDDSSVRAGYNSDEGWCLFGSTVPRSWAVMWLEFGNSLATAVRLVPHPDDVDNYHRWPTAALAAERGNS
jgi:hypothetical protein